MSEADRIYLVTPDASVIREVSGPVHAALLAQAELSTVGTSFEVADDETGSTSTVNLSNCNPWKLLAEIREFTLDDELTDGDTFLAICQALDSAGLCA